MVLIWEKEIQVILMGAVQDSGKEKLGGDQITEMVETQGQVQALPLREINRIFSRPRRWVNTCPSLATEINLMELQGVKKWRHC